MALLSPLHLPPPLLPLLLLLGGVVVSLQQTGLWRQQPQSGGADELDKNTTFCSWKCLKFTLQWPGAFCLVLDSWSDCRVPQEINTWTIHGLWPLRAHNCCRCWTMFHSDVEDLHCELSLMWPSFLKTKSNFHFWNQEWQKHGACAACVEGLNSPRLYFLLCIKLRKQFDIHRALGEAGISPSCNRPYKLAEIHNVLKPLLGIDHEIQCVTDDQQREVWFQVKIPLSRNLTLGCRHRDDLQEEAGVAAGRSLSSGHPCPDHAPFYYFPIDHLKPHQPCG